MRAIHSSLRSIWPVFTSSRAVYGFGLGLGLRYTLWFSVWRKTFWGLGTIKSLPAADMQTCVHVCVCACVFSCLTVATCWHTIDPWLACGGSLFYRPWGDWGVTVCVCGGSDEPQTAPSAVRTIERAGEAQRQGRSSVGQLGRKGSLYCRMKPNINGLEDRCVLCWEIYFPLYGVFTLAGLFDWCYGGRFSLLLDCQYCQCSC